MSSDTQNAFEVLQDTTMQEQPKTPEPVESMEKDMMDVNHVETMEQQQDVVLNEVRDKEEVGKHIGTCKWFNDKLGFGFITIYAGDDKGKDIFVHHSGIKPLNSNYRTLKKGEYINFNIITGLNGLQAVDVTGINGGPLMCDHVIGKKVTPVLNGQPAPVYTQPPPQRRPPTGSSPNQWQVVSRKPRNVEKYNKNVAGPPQNMERKRFPPNTRPYKQPKNTDA
jgi:CspA family cold shock protein